MDGARVMLPGVGSQRIIKLMSDSQIFLKEHRVNRDRMGRGALAANSIWLWGQGKRPYFPSFFERHHVRGAVVAAVDLVKGIGALAGFSGGALLLAFVANGPLLNFYGFVPVALGGLGNNRGAIVGGLALGLFQQAANFLVGGIFSSVAVFALFIIVLLAVPQGLFGTTTTRRV